MATLTKTVTETEGTKKSTWTLITSKQDETTSTNSLQNITLPNLSAKYSAVSGKDSCSVTVQVSLYIGNSNVGSCNYTTTNNVKLAGNTAKALSPQNGHFSASNIFNSQNPTARSVPVLFKTSRIQLDSGKYVSTWEMTEPWGSCDLIGVTSWGTLFNIVLDAPPTFSASNAASDTNGFFAGISTARVTVSSCSAKYGGTITKSQLTIGNQTVTGAGNGTLYIKLSTPGIFTPTVTVTDSRGQTTTKTLDAITVNPYSLPQVTIQSAERTDASGTPDDEGTEAVITAAFSYIEAITDLLRPAVSVGGEAQAASFCTWYASRASDGILSDPVNWSSYHPVSPVTLYGLLEGPFSKERSYVIGITPEDEYNVGLEITQTLPQAYYTIDVYAGGHGIAFGAPATEDGFKVAMPAVFTDAVIFQSMAGAVQMFAGSSAPTGWLICDGRALSRTDYKTLFDIIGTTYGAGDGSTTFNIPDLRDRMPIGAGNSYARNAKAGATTHHHTTGNFTLGVSHIPAHTHGKSGAITSGITSSGAHTHTFKTQADYAAKGTKKGIYSESDGTWSGTSVMTSTGAHTHNLPAHEHTSVGGGQAHNHGNTGDSSNMPPYIGINFIICTGKTN